MIFSLALWLLLPALNAKSVPQHTLTYSQFLRDAGAHQLKSVTIQTNGNAAGTLTNGHDYTTVIPVQLAGSSLLNRLQADKVSIVASTPGTSSGSQVLSWLFLLLPLLFFG